MLRNLWIALAATILCSTVSFAVEPEPAAVCGDVNSSSSVTSADALLVLKKAVAQPITLNCSAYEDRISGCEADLAACAGAVSCGDGSVNAVGEQCDGTDFGGTDCASLGQGGGTLLCSDECKFDASNCGVCPEGSTGFDGACWLLADVPSAEGVGSCDTACASIGLECNQAALQAVGSSGSDADCQAALDAANPPGAPHPISSFSPENKTGCGLPSDYAFGCALVSFFDPGQNGADRILHNGSGTLCEADFRGGTCFTGVRRACACTP